MTDFALEEKIRIYKYLVNKSILAHNKILKAKNIIEAGMYNMEKFSYDQQAQRIAAMHKSKFFNPEWN